ncbi:ASCH domain-containing protein [Lewinella sp. 4G2]|uniref:ASCH domain-containing protein n=1 Tax=Lewinella sp. 4G2 TaxID=1803372 RepID=UPI0007B49B6A|nr:ASCH domain-containing protein [Lewinella sp. 4G2]OAV45689.1 hypothetical protein A3850_014840 [Lewinella sp. 4G2]
MKALFSIKKEFADKIFSGEKRFEFRKAIFKRNVTTIVVYVTKPTGMIVGEFQVKSIVQDSPEGVWNTTQEFAGVDKDFFFKYFNDRSTGYAIEIMNPTLYDVPLDPNRIVGDNKTKFCAPQSFCYLP